MSKTKSINFCFSLSMCLVTEALGINYFLMVGLGEDKDELIQVMDDLRSADVDFITIGQYLQPSPKHHPLNRYYHPDEFKEFEQIAKTKGFLLVSSSPLTRSSYHADEDFRKLQDARNKQLECLPHQ